MRSAAIAKPFAAAMLCALFPLPLAAEELLVNPAFTLRRSNGTPSNWNTLNGTKQSVADGIMTVENPGGKITLTQVFRPQPGKRILFSVDVKCETACKVRAYIECEYKKGSGTTSYNSGSAWKEAKAGEWVTLSGELAPMPENYNKCYLAIWNDSGTPMQIRAPHAETAAPVWLPNADFSQKDGAKTAKWEYRGKAPESLHFEGDAVKLADGFLIQTRLPLATEKNYSLTFAMRGAAGAQGRAYVEWNTFAPDGKKIYGGHCTTGWLPAQQEWKHYTLAVKLPANIDPAYIVLGAKTDLPVEFKELKLEEAK